MAENKTYWKSADQLNEGNPIIEQLEQKELLLRNPDKKRGFYSVAET